MKDPSAQEMSEGPAMGFGGIFEIPQYCPAFGCDVTLYPHMLLDQVWSQMVSSFISSKYSPLAWATAITAGRACASVALPQILHAGMSADIAASFLQCRRWSRHQSR